MAARAPAAPSRARLRALPKAELHAHLGGCARPSTLLELLAAGGATPAVLAAARVQLAAPLTLASAFSAFRLVHAAVASEAALARVVAEALADAAADGVVYIELRTTPRALAPSPGAAALPLPEGAAAGADAAADAPLHRYVAVAAAALAAGAAAHPRLAARLLVSLDRGKPLAAAAAAARVAVAWARSPWVVGVDVSGDPSAGDARALLPLLDAARAAGLRAAVHLGEVRADDEARALLAWGPERVGHACVLADDIVAGLVARGARAPVVETCPTSNVLTLGLVRLADHPTLKTWLESGVRVAVCTDDSGIFGTTLTDELAQIAETFPDYNITKAIDAAFDAAFDAPAAAAARAAASAP